jgi:hypothetical protein
MSNEMSTRSEQVEDAAVTNASEEEEDLSQLQKPSESDPQREQQDMEAPVAVATTASTSLAPVLPKQSNPSRLPFPMKLHRILEDAEETNMKHIISWTHNGEGFKVHNKHAFEAKFIPRYFSTTTYRGYHRNLNLWGFKTINRGGDRGTCWHPYFKRGRQDLCRFMERVGLKGSQSTAGRDDSAHGDISSKTLSDGVNPQHSKALSRAMQFPTRMPVAQQDARTSPEAGLKLPPERECHGDQDKKPAATLQHPQQSLQNQQLFHPNNVLWKQALSNFMSHNRNLRQSASASVATKPPSQMQQQIFPHQQQSSHQMQQLFSMLSSSTNAPMAQVPAGANSYGGNRPSQGDDSLGMLQRFLGTNQPTRSTHSPSDRNMNPQLLLHILQPNALGAAVQSNTVQNPDIASQLQFLLRSQQQQQQAQSDTLQDLMLALQDKRKPPS